MSVFVKQFMPHIVDALASFSYSPRFSVLRQITKERDWILNPLKLYLLFFFLSQQNSASTQQIGKNIRSSLNSLLSVHSLSFLALLLYMVYHALNCSDPLPISFSFFCSISVLDFQVWVCSFHYGDYFLSFCIGFFYWKG